MNNKKILRKKIQSISQSYYLNYRTGLQLSFYIYKFLTILKNKKITIAIIASFIDEIKIYPISTLLNKLKFFILIPFWNNKNNFNLYKLVPKSYVNKFNKGIVMLNYSMPWMNINIKKSVILLIPGLIYDIYGYRLGRGMGFYDKIIKYLLTLSNRNPKLLGIIINKNIKSIIPIKIYDYKINTICSSNKGILKILDPF